MLEEHVLSSELHILLFVFSSYSRRQLVKQTSQIQLLHRSLSVIITYSICYLKLIMNNDLQLDRLFTPIVGYENTVMLSDLCRNQLERMNYIFPDYSHVRK